MNTPRCQCYILTHKAFLLSVVSQVPHRCLVAGHILEGCSIDYIKQLSRSLSLVWSRNATTSPILILHTQPITTLHKASPPLRNLRVDCYLCRQFQPLQVFLSYYHTRLSYSDVTKIKTPFVNLCNFSNNLLYYYYIPRLTIRVSPITSDAGGLGIK